MTATPPRKKLGLALSSGAARGWAHVGVLRGLKEMGVEPDVIAGSSVGALVGGAHLLGVLDDFQQWARELKPLSALEHFLFRIQSGGLIDAAPAFEAFRDRDKNIEDLPIPFGAVASDLSTGEEIWLTEGSTIDAARASSAIPLIFHAVKHQNRWLLDGALVNPTPVSLARKLGADVVISVDLNAVPRVVDRLSPKKAGLPAPLETLPAPTTMTGAVTRLIEDTQRAIEKQIAIARARADATPYLFETAYAAADIFQMQLSRARAIAEPPDILLQPDMRDALPNAFDRADEFIDEGEKAVHAAAGQIQQLLETNQSGADAVA